MRRSLAVESATYLSRFERSVAALYNVDYLLRRCAALASLLEVGYHLCKASIVLGETARVVQVLLACDL